MKKYNLLFLFLLLIIFKVSISQQIYTKENIWLSFNAQYTTEKFRFVLDGSNRTFDNYYNKTRTQFIRFSAAYKLSKGLYVGLGIADALHYSYLNNSSSIDNEIRPFLQLNYFKKTSKANFRFRFRNEFRYWNESEIFKNRIRFQFGYSNLLNNKFKFPVIFYEGFFTPDKKNLIENRFQFGLQYELHHVFTIFPHYMAQIQSNNPYLQNIVGLTLLFSLNNE